MPVRKAIRAVTTAMRDADLARKRAADPAFRRKVQGDRRGALSEFGTVRQALADREKAERATGGRPKAEPDAPRAGGSKRQGSRARPPAALRGLARTVVAASRDADRARKAQASGELRREVGRDRRAALSKFDTVKQALADRERIEKGGRGKK